ncbi:DUF2442 domain-containing protein [uncultured Treponema sp.]|uniref:DUF2442 domain-containing protein n=1 Tax=uncultured Treponema sp. TaxID=162155 RepID=UPI0025DBFDBB|nr:DUF2442 domain-containing protein [uncultured Treponema sp.]
MEIVQVYPQDNYDVVLYFVDGKIKKYNVSHLVGQGVFKCLEDIDFYKNNCTVLNHTLAWTLDGKYDSSNCLDLDPYVLYNEGIEIADPLQEIA